MESIIVPVRLRGNTRCLKFAKLLKTMFGVSFKRESLWTKDVFFSIEKMYDRYRIRVSRITNKGFFIKVFDFNGIPSFLVPGGLLSSDDSIGVSISNIDGVTFISPGGSDGFYMSGSKRYIVLNKGFKCDEYCLSLKDKDGVWCISLDSRVKDNEIPASTLGGSVTFSLEYFDDIRYYHDENGNLKGVKCEINYEENYLDLLRVVNDS